MRVTLLFAALLLAACAAQGPAETSGEAEATAAQAAETQALSGPEAAMAQAAARAAAGQPCHDIPAQAFEARADDIQSTTKSGGFTMEVVSPVRQPTNCSGVGDDNTCEISGEAFVRASVPGLTRHYHVPAAYRADMNAGARTLSCSMRPAAQ